MIDHIERWIFMKNRDEPGRKPSKVFRHQYVSMDGWKPKLWEGNFTISDTKRIGVGTGPGRNPVILCASGRSELGNGPCCHMVMQSRITEKDHCLLLLSTRCSKHGHSRGNRYCKQYSAPSLPGDRICVQTAYPCFSRSNSSTFPSQPMMLSSLL